MKKQSLKQAEMLEGESKMENNKLVWIRRGIYIAIAILSFAVLANIATNPDNYAKTYENLNNSEAAVTKMAAGAAAASTAITLIPGDAGTPIAEELANLTGYFVFIYATILVEKYLITIGAALAFRILIPIACVIMALLFKKVKYRQIAIKLFIFSFVIWLVVPLSTAVSGIINAAHQTSLETKIEETQKNIDEINEAAESAESEDDTWLDKTLNKAKTKVAATIEKFEGLLSQTIESIAIMIVTNCVIPIAIFVFLIWIIRTLFGLVIHIPVPDGRHMLRTVMKKDDRDTRDSDQ